MKAFAHSVIILCLSTCALFSQTRTFKENTKWGIKDGNTIVIAPVYDSIFNFDGTGKVCLACFKGKSSTANRYFKTSGTVFNCNYLNKAGKRLVIATEENKDTCSVFLLGKTTVAAFNDNPSHFTVSAKNKRYLVTKDFKQMTFKGHYDIVQSPDPEYYVVQEVNDYGTTLAHLIDRNEDQVIPFDYSGIRINPYDSLIVCCSAGIRTNAMDDVFNYDGKKIASYRRHVDLATKNFIIHKIFEPKEYYIIYNLETKEEKSLNADEVQPSPNDEILIKLKNDWYLYDLNTHKKKLYKPS